MLLINKTIFIVEDNNLNRAIYEISLGKNGARLEFDQWGKTTLEKLQHIKKPDLIILDLMLPNGISGFDVFEKIRDASRYQDIPIIAVSASDPSSAVPKAKSMGFSGFISKPIDYALFPQQIVKVITGEKIWA